MSERKKQSRVKVIAWRWLVIISSIAAIVLLIAWKFSYDLPAAFLFDEFADKQVDAGTVQSYDNYSYNLLIEKNRVETPGYEWAIWSVDGQLGVFYFPGMFLSVSGHPGDLTETIRMGQVELPSLGSRVGFPYFSMGKLQYAKWVGVVIGIPHWLLLIITLIAPILWLRNHMIREKRIELGCCLTCGYDLRESKGACPECGRPREPVARPT